MKQVILYGLTGADQQYRPARWFVIEEDLISIQYIQYAANTMKIKFPSVEHVYALDNRPELRRDFQECIKKNTIESCAVFRDICERYGLKVI